MASALEIARDVHSNEVAPPARAFTPAASIHKFCLVLRTRRCKCVALDILKKSAGEKWDDQCVSAFDAVLNGAKSESEADEHQND